MSAPGIRRATRRVTTTMAMTAAATARVVIDVSPRWASVEPSLARVSVAVTRMPSSCGSWPIATEMPTPVRNPMSTVRDRKLARNPSRTSLAISKSTPAISPVKATNCRYRWLPGTATPATPAARIAAVAESAATTKWRDDPRIAKTAIGSSIV